MGIAPLDGDERDAVAVVVAGDYIADLGLCCKLQARKAEDKADEDDTIPHKNVWLLIHKYKEKMLSLQYVKPRSNNGRGSGEPPFPAQHSGEAQAVPRPDRVRKTAPAAYIRTLSRRRPRCRLLGRYIR